MWVTGPPLALWIGSEEPHEGAGCPLLHKKCRLFVGTYMSVCSHVSLSASVRVCACHCSFISVCVCERLCLYFRVYRKLWVSWGVDVDVSASVGVA